MIAAALALLVVGIVLGLLIPPFGFIVAGVGALLLVLYLFGVGRTIARTR